MGQQVRKTCYNKCPEICKYKQKNTKHDKTK